MRDFLIKLAEDETDFERRKRLQDLIIASINAFSAEDHLSRDQLHDRDAVLDDGRDYDGVRVENPFGNS